MPSMVIIATMTGTIAKAWSTMNHSPRIVQWTQVSRQSPLKLPITALGGDEDPAEPGTRKHGGVGNGRRQLGDLNKQNGERG